MAIALLLLAGVCVPTSTLADSILIGTVTDAVTGQPVTGAEVKVEYAGRTLGVGTTAAGGAYSAAFALPAEVPDTPTLIATISSPNHDVTRSNFQVAGGAAPSGFDVALFPKGTAACLSQTEHSVIVGHFLPPPQQEFPDLPQRVALSLDFALTTRLQQVRLAAGLAPSFQACDAAKVTNVRLGARLAKALQADAYIGGTVVVDPPAFSVTTYVSDAHALLPGPAVTSSRGVDLGNPSAATIADETHTAVLAAVAAGLAAKDDCVGAIAVVAVAEQMAPAVPPYLASLRRDCEARLPNVGLLGSAP